VRKPRWRGSPPPTAPAAIVVLILSLTGCSAADPGPFPTAPTAAPPTTVVLPGPTSTTIGSPAVTPEPDGQGQWTFVVVRHANRAGGGTDPPLTEAGEIRARRLADLIYTYPGVAVYATRFRRTQDTARPTAVLWDVPVTTYDATLSPADLVNQIKQRHPRGAILIVGDSDTVPGIVTELCRCRIDPIPEEDYANRYEVTVQSDGSVLRIDHYTSY
jgi:histidine phosphatase superfamily protein (branch 1)